LSKKALITGITGMAGSHLADYLLTLDGVEVNGTKRWRSREENIAHLHGKINLYELKVLCQHHGNRQLKQ